MTFRGQIAFKPEYEDEISGAELFVPNIDGLTFVGDSAMIGSNLAKADTLADGVHVPLTSFDEPVRLCYVPNLAGDIAVNGFVRFTLRGERITQPIGMAVFSAENLSINAPYITASESVYVTGVAAPGANVTVYVNGAAAGDEIVISVSKSVLSYSGIGMAADYESRSVVNALSLP